MKFVSVLRRLASGTLVSISAVMGMAPTAHAAAYGQGLYGAGLYSQGFVQIGPVTLPVTGPQLLGIVSALCIGIAVGLVVWTRGRRRQSTPQA